MPLTLSQREDLIMHGLPARDTGEHVVLSVQDVSPVYDNGTRPLVPVSCSRAQALRRLRL